MRQGAALSRLHLLRLSAPPEPGGERHLGPAAVDAPPSAPQAARVDEDHRRTVPRNQVEQLGWMEARCFSGPVSRSRTRRTLQLAELRQIVHGIPPDLELLLRAGVDDGDAAAATLPTDLPPRGACHFVQRPLGGREADALQLAPGQLLKPLQGEEEVRAALGCDQRVDLVDDDGLTERRISRAARST